MSVHLLVLASVASSTNHHGRKSNAPIRRVNCSWANAQVLDVHWKMCTYPPAEDVRISGDFHLNGCYECAAVSDMLQQLRRHQASLVDVGANIGSYTLPAAADGHPVYSFELMPSNAAQLQASLIGNRLESRVRLFPIALGATPTWVMWGDGSKAKNKGGFSMMRAARRSNASSTSLSANPNFPVITLDSLPPISGPVFLKMVSDRCSNAAALAHSALASAHWQSVSHFIPDRTHLGSRSSCALVDSRDRISRALSAWHCKAPTSASFTRPI